MIEEILSTFGFSKYEVNLSTRPEKSVGSDAIWNTAEAALVQALGMKEWDYVVDNGGGAFYGPKIDIKVGGHCIQSWYNHKKGKYSRFTSIGNCWPTNAVECLK